MQLWKGGASVRKPSVSQIIQTTRDIAASFEMQFGPRRARSLQVAGASCIVSAGAGMGKLAMGLISLSLFTCVSAFYSFAMVVAKVVALSALVRETGREEQTRYCKLAGRLLVAASALYMLYSARLFWHPVERGFHLYIAIGIAAFTFFELALNIRGVLVERRNRAPLFYTLKTINLASACINLVLTQRALLALEAEENYVVVHTHANILIGLLMGGCALLLGVRLILRMKRMAAGITGIQTGGCAVWPGVPGWKCAGSRPACMTAVKCRAWACICPRTRARTTSPVCARWQGICCVWNCARSRARL